MKEQVLGASDRAALQSLVPLAGALGAGTIFALFFGGRRHRTGVAVFEVFAIVSVLVLVSIAGRLPGSVERAFAILPLILVASGSAFLVPFLRPRRTATLTTLVDSEPRKRALRANEDGLLDVTDARLLG